MPCAHPCLSVLSALTVSCPHNCPSLAFMTSLSSHKLLFYVFCGVSVIHGRCIWKSHLKSDVGITIVAARCSPLGRLLSLLSKSSYCLLVSDTDHCFCQFSLFVCFLSMHFASKHSVFPSV